MRPAFRGGYFCQIFKENFVFHLVASTRRRMGFSWKENVSDSWEPYIVGLDVITECGLKMTVVSLQPIENCKMIGVSLQETVVESLKNIIRNMFIICSTFLKSR